MPLVHLVITHAKIFMQHPTVGLRKNLIKRGNKPCGLTIDHPVGYYSSKWLAILWEKGSEWYVFWLTHQCHVLFIKIGFSVHVDCPLSSSGIKCECRSYSSNIVVCKVKIESGIQSSFLFFCTKMTLSSSDYWLRIQRSALT